MAPLPANQTVRAWIDYSTGGGEHSLQLRFQAGASSAVVQAKLQELSALLAPLWTPQTTTQGFRMSAAGTDFSFELGGSSVVGTAPGSIAEINYPRFVSAVGRSSGGRRVRYFLYGVQFTPESDYRMELLDVADLDTVRAWLDDPNNFLVAIDGNATTLKPYWNWGYNAYYQRKARVT